MERPPRGGAVRRGESREDAMSMPAAGTTKPRIAVIIGAGPAGLTAAYELLQRTDVQPIVLEKSDHLGGISRTVNYKGNRIDIGGHRFFSKSQRVMNWWLNFLPMQATSGGGPQTITYQQQSRSVAAPAAGPDPVTTDQVMLIRERTSRIYYRRRFFDYPIRLSKDTVAKLGLFSTGKIGFSYFRSVLFPIKREKNLEQFLINRFGRELYLTFFKSYTEKVWGVPCTQISAEWGAQRIKGLSVTKAITHALKSLKKKKASGNGDIRQENVETSLIEQFLYPKHGPGQMWEEVTKQVVAKGGQVLMQHDVTGLTVEGNRITAVEAVDRATGQKKTLAGDFFFSTMPMQELVRDLRTEVPAQVKEISEGLVYRDFITVGLLLKDLKIKPTEPGRKLIRDNWIYIQEPDVLLGRLQVFNNWSPYMVADPTKVWVGLEYFCYETDALWKQTDAAMIELAKTELDKIGIIEKAAVLDATVLRMPKTYPAYFGTYDRFDDLRGWLDRFENLFLVGRNGMHKYNNQDHSMLTAMVAVDNIAAGVTDKGNLWAVNTEQEYHEEKK
jgi:protoporphyrinogen oxidase